MQNVHQGTMTYLNNYFRIKHAMDFKSLRYFELPTGPTAVGTWSVHDLLNWGVAPATVISLVAYERNSQCMDTPQDIG